MKNQIFFLLISFFMFSGSSFANPEIIEFDNEDDYEDIIRRMPDRHVVVLLEFTEDGLVITPQSANAFNIYDVQIFNF